MQKLNTAFQRRSVEKIPARSTLLKHPIPNATERTGRAAGLPVAVAGIAIVVLSGCARDICVHPDMARTLRESSDILEEMARNPKPLRRELVFVHGWRLSGHVFERFVHWIRRCTTNADRMLVVAEYSSAAPVPGVAEEIFEGRRGRGEVDIVAHSMGGLVARCAAERELVSVHSLYTLASPHGGVALTRFMPWDAQARDMVPGSDLLRMLDSGGPPSYPVRTYWMQGDRIVTRHRARMDGAPHTVVPRSPRPVCGPHSQIVRDERVILDVLRRLLSEEEDLLTSTGREALYGESPSS